MNIKEYADKSALCWLATADNNGLPNVSPKEIFLLFNDNTVLIANIASPQSEKNIRQNSNVCVSFIDIFEQKGYKLTGTAQIMDKTDIKWKRYFEPLSTLAGPDFPIHNIFEFSIKTNSPILAPSYALFPNTTKEKQIQSALNNSNRKTFIFPITLGAPNHVYKVLGTTIFYLKQYKTTKLAKMQRENRLVLQISKMLNTIVALLSRTTVRQSFI